MPFELVKSLIIIKDVGDLRHKLEFTQAEFEAERNEMNDVVIKSRDLVNDKGCRLVAFTYCLALTKDSFYHALKGANLNLEV